MAKTYYYTQASQLNQELKKSIPPERLKALHRKRPWLHFAIALRQLAILVAMPLLIYHFPNPFVVVPAIILQGFTVFNFSILLHEVVHKCVFNKDSAGWTARLGQLYGTLSGLSCAQFTRWHMDHHEQLGDAAADPKRAHLSPKIHARWYKLLYCTPALYPIYFAAARRASAAYSPELRARIAVERRTSIGFHLAVMGLMAWLVSPAFALLAWAIPIFIVFPVAFTLNRLGQHYVIDPDDVAQWSTLIRPNALWNFIFLYSSYHLEHHYFPAVPFYNLEALQRELDPFYAKRGIPSFSYTRLLYLWFVRNHKPHTSPGPG